MPFTIGIVHYHLLKKISGGKDFLVESLDASFRYPQDFSFHIQNFTTAVYNRVVEPKRQATFDYAFTPNEAFAGRPFGLVINLNYKDAVSIPKTRYLCYGHMMCIVQLQWE